MSNDDDDGGGSGGDDEERGAGGTGDRGAEVFSTGTSCRCQVAISERSE